MLNLIRSVCISLALAAPPAAVAGSSASGNPDLPGAEVAVFADRVQHDLAARGVQVAIVGRVGRDPAVLPAGVRYTHVAFWVYSRITRADGTQGQGYRVYNLYQRDGDLTRSDLVQDSPAEFFANVHALDAGVIIPDPRLQQKLLAVIASPTYAALHNTRYAVLSNPRSSSYQNCTEHTLDVLMAALYDTSNAQRIKANIAAHFTPQVIAVGGLQRLFAPVASAALTTDDHQGQIATATFGSLARFFEAQGLADLTYRITPDRLQRF